MSSSDSHDDTPDSDPVFSRDAVTPRGGFMARPGLKPPPRHAVVVRVGDARDSEHIPVARSSIPPPPPPSEPALVSLHEKATVRRIPTPSNPPPPVAPSEPPCEQQAPALSPEPTFTFASASAYPVIDSVPPPSDAAVVASVREPGASGPRSRRASSSRWTIVAAAAAGLLLGIVSVATTLREPHGASRAPTSAAMLDSVQQGAAQSARAKPGVSNEPRLAAPPRERPLAIPVSVARPASPAPKRSIF